MDIFLFDIKRNITSIISIISIKQQFDSDSRFGNFMNIRTTNQQKGFGPQLCTPKYKLKTEKCHGNENIKITLLLCITHYSPVALVWNKFFAESTQTCSKMEFYIRCTFLRWNMRCCLTNEEGRRKWYLQPKDRNPSSESQPMTQQTLIQIGQLSFRCHLIPNLNL